MGTLQVIKMLKPFIFLAVIVTLASGDLRKECKCGLFMTNKNHEVEIKRLHAIDINDCSEFDVCLSECAKVANKYTQNGDLEAQYGVPSYGLTVGQEICLQAERAGYSHIYWEPVYGYANACDGPWDWTGFQMKKPLCCRHGHYKTCGT